MSKQQRQAAAFTLVAFAAVAVAGCDKSASEAKAEQAPTAENESAAVAPQPEDAKSDATETKAPAQGAPAQGHAALARYESIRAALAKDAVASTTAEAAALEKSAKSAASAAAGAVGKKWSKLAEAAKRLHEIPKDDADSVRKAFGDVSQALIAILTANETLAKGLHVFECPMAQGYEKWVQPAPTISNPYMGTRMPKCGSSSSL